MTRSDERALLEAVDRGGRGGVWLCHIRREIPGASSVRVLAGLAALNRGGLISERRGAYAMATYRLTAAGRERLKRPGRRQRKAATGKRRRKTGGRAR